MSVATVEPHSVNEPVPTLEALLDRVRELSLDIRQLIGERDHYKQLATLLQQELERLKDLQKTPREHVDTDQAQLAFEQIVKQLLEKTGAKPDSADAGAAASSEGGEGGKPNGKKPPKRTPHGRGVLPEHLPVRTLVLTPADMAPGAVEIDQEISWRLGFQRAGFYRLKLVRPVYSVDKEQDVDGSKTQAVLYEGSPPETHPQGRSTVQAEVSTAATCVAEPAPTAVSGNEPAVATPSDAHVRTDPQADASPAEAPLSGSDASTKLVCADLPAEMVPRGLPTADLLAHIITDKFADNRPLHRQERIFAREAVAISRTNMCRWIEQAHQSCKRVVEAMATEALATAAYICTDATGVLVQANERCKKGHFWALIAERMHVLFRYSTRHSSDEPKAFLKGYSGTVVADASNVYDALFRLPEGPKEAGCNAHARRYFFKALDSDKPRALIGLGFYNALFDLERQWTKLPPSQRLALRQQHAAPLMEKLRIWRDEVLASSSAAEGSPIRRALQYSRNHWEALTRFLRDGRIPAHNNWSELELRRLVVGRAAWLFVGSDESAEWTCTFVSLVASCGLHNLDPEGYFQGLFRVLPVWPQTRLLELAPRYWARTRERLNPDELARPLGPITVPAPLSLAEQPPE